MPFIRGRYYVNPAAGQALEAARDLEAQLLASRGPNREDDEPEDSDRHNGASEKGPIQRIEIETAELVPSRKSSAEKGYVARIHRRNMTDLNMPRPTNHGEAHVFYDKAALLNFLNDQFGKDAKANESAQGKIASECE